LAHAFGSLQESRDNRDERSFASTVMPEQGEYLPNVHLKVDTIHCFKSARVGFV
jgi:hypothetical protein